MSLPGQDTVKMLLSEPLVPIEPGLHRGHDMGYEGLGMASKNVKTHPHVGPQPTKHSELAEAPHLIVSHAHTARPSWLVQGFVLELQWFGLVTIWQR